MPATKSRRFPRAAPRVALSPEFVSATRDFLRTAGVSSALVHALHAWLDRRRLAITELTPRHIQRFLVRPQRMRITSTTRANYHHLLRPYLQHLHDHELIGFDPDRLRRHPKRLPSLALQFLASLAPTRARGTCCAYASTLRKFHSWLDEHRLVLPQLTRQEIAPWFQELHAAGFHAATRIHLLQNVRSYLHWLNERQKMRTAPDDLVRSRDLPKLPSYLPRPLTAEADRELQQRLDASSDPGAWALLLMRRTGLRSGELRGLDYHCQRSDGGRPLLKVPLGKMNNERLVPLDPKAVALITRLQSVAPRTRPWLVPASIGRSRQMSYWHLSDVLQEHSQDLPDPVRITSHRLRHTYATEMLSAGMSLLGVMRLLGHRDYRMTLRYTAITPETVGDEYHKALANLATKYRLLSTPTLDYSPDPDELLKNLARWLRKHVPSSGSSRALQKRIARMQQEVEKLASSTRK